MARSKRLHPLLATIAAGMTLVAPALLRAQQQPSPGDTPPASQTAQRDLDQLAAALVDEGTRTEDRDEAARRLVSRQSDEARRILLSVLVSAGNRNGQLAVARALAGDPNPDPRFVVPLFALIGPDRPLTEAAAAALAAYKGDPDVVTRLISLATARQQAAAVRAACVRALGSLNEKRVADALVSLLASDDENNVVRSAAADALIQLTGLRENGRDVQRWEQWWQRNAGKSEAEWRQELLNVRAARLDVLQNRYAELSAEVQRVLDEQYQLVPEAQKPDVAMRYLKAGEPVIRALGASLIVGDMQANRSIPQALRDQLRKMIGDSAPEVRLEVARALGALNDAASLEPLLAQLVQERDPDVKAQIARALAPIRDLRAVPELRRLLRDPSYVAAEAAATALWQLGPYVREADAAVAEALAIDLRNVLDARANNPGSARFRETVVRAMVPLRQPALMQVFYRLLTGRQTPEVRRWAVKGLGELGDRKAASLVVDALEDPDATVRLEAVEALRTTGSIVNLESLYARMNPQQESDPSVRERAWQVVLELLKTAPRPTLSAWRDRFTNEQFPERRLAVLKLLADAQQKEKDAESLAYTQQSIGETLVRLGQPAEAVPYFRSALDYWSEPSRNAERVTVGLTLQLLNAQLRARQYAEAATFGASLIQADRANQGTVGPAFRAECERLRNTGRPGDLQDALALIAESRKMRPPLDARFANDLSDIDADIRRQTGIPSGGSTNPAGPRSAGAAPARPAAGT